MAVCGVWMSGGHGALRRTGPGPCLRLQSGGPRTGGRGGGEVTRGQARLQTGRGCSDCRVS